LGGAWGIVVHEQEKLLPIGTQVVVEPLATAGCVESLDPQPPSKPSMSKAATAPSDGLTKRRSSAGSNLMQSSC